MIIIRSSKCTTKFATKTKLQELKTILPEYGNTVNYFIDYFWKNPTTKYEVLKPIVDLHKTWLSFRLRSVATQEAIDMIASVKEVFEWNKQQIQNRIDLLEEHTSELQSRQYL